MRILLIGPQGCGKTRNAKKVAAAFGVPSKLIFDGFAAAPNSNRICDLRKDGLFITHKLPRGIRREHFDIVIEVNGENKLEMS